jgi:hypothetical protein
MTWASATMRRIRAASISSVMTNAPMPAKKAPAVIMTAVCRDTDISDEATEIAIR